MENEDKMISAGGSSNKETRKRKIEHLWSSLHRHSDVSSASAPPAQPPRARSTVAPTTSDSRSFRLNLSKPSNPPTPTSTNPRSEEEPKAEELKAEELKAEEKEESAANICVAVQWGRFLRFFEKDDILELPGVITLHGVRGEHISPPEKGYVRRDYNANLLKANDDLKYHLREDWPNCNKMEKIDEGVNNYRSSFSLLRLHHQRLPKHEFEAHAHEVYMEQDDYLYFSINKFGKLKATLKEGVELHANHFDETGRQILDHKALKALLEKSGFFPTIHVQWRWAKIDGVSKNYQFFTELHFYIDPITLKFMRPPKDKLDEEVTQKYDPKAPMYLV